MALDAIRARIEATHPVVTKVDFDLGTQDDLVLRNTALAWNFWLKHHCRCLEGEDLSRTIAPFRPSAMLAAAVNGDYSRVLRGYVTRILAGGSSCETQRLMREASRKALRSTNILRSDDDKDWPGSLEDHFERFCRLFPDQHGNIEILLKQTNAAAPVSDDFVPRLRNFIDWMDEEVGRRQLSFA